MPSAETLRRKLDLIGKNKRFVEAIRECSVNFWKKSEREPGTEPIGGGEYVRLDIDTVPYDNSDTHKEGIAPMKGTSMRGYNPIFAHLGTDGWMIDAALRPGNYHCHNPENVAFVKSATSKLDFSIFSG